METKTNLGRVSLVPKGAYNPETQYERLDLVQYQGAAYVVRRAVQGVEPSDGEDYMLLMEPGTGETGGTDGTGGGIPDGIFAIRAQADNPALGTVSGGGLVFGGVMTTVTAEPVSGFYGWEEENGGIASDSLSYTFVVDRDRTLLAKFTAPPAPPPFTGWEAAKLPASGNWYSVAYGDGTFVSVLCDESAGSNIAAYSTDGGKTWEKATMPSSKMTWMGVAYGGGAFFAAAAKDISASDAYGSKMSARSVDGGRTWTPLVMPSKKIWKTVAYGNGTFVAAAYRAGAVAYSTDQGLSWTEVPVSFSYSGLIASDGGSRFVLVEDYSYGTNRVAYSEDCGKTWEVTTFSKTAWWNSVTYGDGVFLVTAHNTNYAAYSTDGGKTWQLATLPVTSNWRNCAYGDGIFVIIGEGADGNAVYSTDNCLTWQTAPNLPSDKWRGLAYGGGKFVASPYSSTAAYSA